MSITISGVFICPERKSYMSSKILAVVGVILLCVCPIWADEPEIILDPIVITPYRYEENLSKTTSSATVITQGEINDSNAQKVVDTLRAVPGVVVRDYYGNGAAATVDIAGFGEQAALNVLVLIDGRRVNDVDLSGVDWSQIPLDQVERIEIIRGGAAGVLYGDNASSGVINIVTRKGSGRQKVKMQAEYGSYDLNKQKLSLEGSMDDKTSYLFNVEHSSTNGYRGNSFNKAKDFSSKLEHSFTEILSLRFDSGFHDSTYGMPSGLFQHHINEQSRRWARYAKDHANNKDYYLVLGPSFKPSDEGSLDADFSYRRKETDSYFPSSNNDTRRNKIETFGFTPKYTISSSIADHENKLVSGIDCYRVMYKSRNFVPPSDTSLKNYVNTNKNSLGFYMQDEFSLLEQLVLVGGYRNESARYVFGYHDFTGTNPDLDSKIKPKMEAFSSGVVYNYAEDSNAFFNAGKSFRFPEVDEFIGMYDINFHQFLNTNLLPQSALNYQAGLRHKFNSKLKGSFSLFRMKVKNYIYFNPTGGVWGFGENENYDKTIHEGLESSLDAKLNSRVNLSGSYTFTSARFSGGPYDKNEIPMVPRHKASAGFRFLLSKGLTLNLTGNYTGKRYFINDQGNAVSRLNGYVVTDTNVSWHYKDMALTFGINNLFDKQYSEYGVYGTDSSNGFAYDKCYFPSPGRNFNLKADFIF